LEKDNNHQSNLPDEAAELMESLLNDLDYLEQDTDTNKMKMYFWVSLLDNQLSKMISQDYFSNMCKFENSLHIENTILQSGKS